jgi:hypothetical protein
VTNRPPAGALLLAIVALAGCATSRDSAARPSEPPRRVDPTAGTVIYQGKTIVFDEATDPPRLVIDGKSIEVSRRGDTEHTKTKFGTSIIAYADYPSLWQLARAIVDGHLLGYFPAATSAP